MPFESMLTISAVVLIVSGGAKIHDPAPTRGALRAARLPSGRWAVAGLGTGELAVGSAALVLPGPWPPLAVGFTYLAFAAFVAHALRSGIPLQSCGCFGRPDTPPTWIHVIVNGVFAAGAVAAAWTGTPIADRLVAAPATGLLELAFSLVGAYLVYLLLAELPSTLAAARKVVS